MTPLSLNRVVRSSPGWYVGDFHCHTYHSDGKLSPVQLLDVARQEGLDFFTITDHNTTAAYGEFGDPDDMLIIPGLEVTFDHGHFNVFGIEHALPWTDPFCPGPTEIELRETTHDLGELLRVAATAGLVTSINHPVLPPWAWCDPDTDLTHVDCVEIWNDPSWPDNHVANPAAVELWNQWLSEGYRITAIGGSDYHRPAPKTGSPRKPERLGSPHTVVYAQNLSGRAILEGIRRGRAYMSMGPQVTFTGRWNGQTVDMGQDLGCASGSLTLNAQIDAGYSGRAMFVRNGRPIAEAALDGDQAHLEWTGDLDPEQPAWFRLDVHATQPQHPDELLWAITNPIYTGPTRTPVRRRYGDYVETPIIRQRADRLQWPKIKPQPPTEQQAT